MPTRRSPGWTTPGALQVIRDDDTENPTTTENHSREGELGARAMQALRYGKTFGNDSSSSAALRSALVGMVNAGWSRDRIVTAMFDTNNQGAAKVQKLDAQRGTRRAMKFLDREIEQARKYVARNAQVLDANGALFAVTEWRERVSAARWRGAGGITDRNTLDAFGRRSEALKSATSIPMSMRALGEEIGTHAGTASRSVGRVIEAGWLRRVHRSDNTRPAVYALAFPRCEATATSPHTDLARELSHLLHSLGPGHDAWRWKALGKGPQRVYALVLQNLGAATIASQLGISRRAVYQHLARLCTAGLVEPAGSGGWSATEKTLAEVAVEYGTDGAGEEQRAAHERHRAAYHRSRL
jgi:predicted transcriptional regulator